ncbi:uncharacterized protein LOC113867260 [Abrus precatorius]|uniref:Uncharacterized protein LOC113867260 n=1 Tax=Abrus precatorius TaxID=3816 RepID=A0A8B8LQY2_ABRPR|nr:uncharacterized protein LOC113867260 [Abrus precatorius]
MDIDEWEFLSDDGYLDFSEDGEKKQISFGKGNLDSKSVFDMEYFCSSPPRKSRVHNQLVPLPIQLEPRICKASEDVLVKDMIKIATPSEKAKDFEVVEADQDTVSQVFFKIKESEFVDMKMDSPKSCNRGLLPPMDASAFKFEDKSEAKEIITSPRRMIEKGMFGMESDKEEDSTWEEENNSGFNIWKWSLTGVGAICSFGVAAATICVLFFGTQQRNKLKQEQQIRFQIYADDKRIKQVVQHATKLNEAISAGRGVQMSRAHISIGGYYDGL